LVVVVSGTSDEGRARVILANPQRMFVETLVPALESADIDVVQVATSRAGLLQAVQRHPDALCLSAWSFSDGGLAEVIGDIRATAPGCRVVVLCGDSDPNTLSGALTVGVQGFIHTSRGLDVLLSLMRRLLAGEVVIEASLAREEVSSTREAQRIRKLATFLTPREQECLVMLVSGLDTAAMSHRLGVSRTTIRSHVQSLMMKLGVHSRLEAAALAVQHQLLQAAGGQRVASAR
jgi:two-component system nitrate/nitrite response regulator NarL